MKRRNVIATESSLVILILTLIILNPSYAQNKREPIPAFSGLIERVSTDSHFIAINETKISLSPKTQITNERGDNLSIYDLKPGNTITIEVLKNPNGFVANKIVVKKKLSRTAKEKEVSPK